MASCMKLAVRTERAAAKTSSGHELRATGGVGVKREEELGMEVDVRSKEVRRARVVKGTPVRRPAWGSGERGRGGQGCGGTGGRMRREARLDSGGTEMRMRDGAESERE